MGTTRRLAAVALGVAAAILLATWGMITLRGTSGSSTDDVPAITLAPVAETSVGPAGKTPSAAPPDPHGAPLPPDPGASGDPSAVQVRTDAGAATMADETTPGSTAPAPSASTTSGGARPVEPLPPAPAGRAAAPDRDDDRDDDDRDDDEPEDREDGEDDDDDGGDG